MDVETSAAKVHGEQACQGPDPQFPGGVLQEAVTAVVDGQFLVDIEPGGQPSVLLVDAEESSQVGACIEISVAAREYALDVPGGAFQVQLLQPLFIGVVPPDAVVVGADPDQALSGIVRQAADEAIDVLAGQADGP